MELETTTKVPVERLRLDRGNPTTWSRSCGPGTQTSSGLAKCSSTRRDAMCWSRGEAWTPRTRARCPPTRGSPRCCCARGTPSVTRPVRYGPTTGRTSRSSTSPMTSRKRRTCVSQHGEEAPGRTFVGGLTALYLPTDVVPARRSTSGILPERRKVVFITPIPKPKNCRAGQPRAGPWRRPGWAAGRSPRRSRAPQAAARKASGG